MIKNRFVLIDAFALIFRAYFALPPSLTKDGHPIQAVYGFTSALLSAIKTLQPEYLAVGMDKGKSHRIKEFEAYKIHRKPTPDDLVSQIPYVKKVLEVMNVPCFSEEGFEGEDIIATIISNVKGHPESSDEGSLSLSEKSHPRPILDASRRSAQNDTLEYIIVTGDMDLLQLIDNQTKVYSMARGVNQAALYDENKVIERYGLKPSQFVDFKALKGDPSDNIPGVPGIGEKGASKLIQEYGTIERIYEEISNVKLKMTNEDQSSNDKINKKIPKNTEISEKIQKILLENKEQAFLSKKLSKIYDQVPLEFNINDAKIHQYDRQKTIALFNQLGFKSLIPRLHQEEKRDNQQKLF